MWKGDLFLWQRYVVLRPNRPPAWVRSVFCRDSGTARVSKRTNPTSLLGSFRILPRGPEIAVSLFGDHRHRGTASKV